MKKEEALRIIFTCADKFEQNLANKNLLFICVDKHMKINTMEVVFSRANYLHMTGIKFCEGKKLSANQFYKMCIKRRLSTKDFELSYDGTTELKLQVLAALVESNISANMIGDYSGSRPMLYTHKLAGNVKGCIGFLIDGERGYYVPNTILKEDIRKLVVDGKRVIRVYRKDVSKKKYDEIVYQAKKIDWDKIELGKEILGKINE